MLTYTTFVLGPIENNSAVIFDDDTLTGAIIDPSLEPQEMVDFILKKKLTIDKILLTHGHFDHCYGLPYVQSHLPDVKEIYLHPNDLLLYRTGGSARRLLGYVLDLPEPTHMLKDGQVLSIGAHSLLTLSTPGHTPGSVVFYAKEAGVAFCGDLIFYHGVGRTDLEGGDFHQLDHSIREKIFTLPDSTKIIPGHGPDTTVQEEKLHNPFIK